MEPSQGFEPLDWSWSRPWTKYCEIIYLFILDFYRSLYPRSNNI